MASSDMLRRCSIVGAGFAAGRGLGDFFVPARPGVCCFSPFLRLLLPGRAAVEPRDITNPPGLCADIDTSPRRRRLSLPGVPPPFPLLCARAVFCPRFLPRFFTVNLPVSACGAGAVDGSTGVPLSCSRANAASNMLCWTAVRTCPAATRFCKNRAVASSLLDTTFPVQAIRGAGFAAAGAGATMCLKSTVRFGMAPNKPAGAKMHKAMRSQEP